MIFFMSVSASAVYPAISIVIDEMIISVLVNM